MPTSITCPACSGTGVVRPLTMPSKPCEGCSGTGIVRTVLGWDHGVPAGSRVVATGHLELGPDGYFVAVYDHVVRDERPALAEAC